MSARFNMDDYVDVAERIHSFYERFPEGSLQSGHRPEFLAAGDKLFIVYHALAYRTPDDPRPAHGWAWEPVPGPTQFTKDSELQNAETAAWGRAIVALGFETKKIASRQEVRNRQPDTARPTQPKPAPKIPAKSEKTASEDGPNQDQLALIDRLVTELAALRNVDRAKVLESLTIKPMTAEWRTSETSAVFAIDVLRSWAKRAAETAA